MNNRIQLLYGDITKQKVDVIVNAANTTLLGGGGVDDAIHRAAGPELLTECKTLNSCKTGKAKITRGYNLPAKFVIHTPGPVWHGGSSNEEELLRNCYKNSFRLALENSLRSISFPNISTGVYRFPKEQAAGIALSEANIFLETNKDFEKVLFVCFDQTNFDIYKKSI